jgi:microtubule-associated protein-like 6
MIAAVRTNLDMNQSEIKPDDKGELSDSVKGRAIAVSPDGLWIIMGFKDGTVRLFDKDVKQKQVTKIAKEWISDIKFSPDGSMIALGSHDNSIYLYTFPEMKLFHKPLRKHSEFIKNIDFSADGRKIHSTCGGFDLLFWDIEVPKQLPNGAMLLRNEKWHTWTSLLGWPVQGIWKENSDGTDVNCCDRSHSNYSGKDQPPDNYYLLAVGNDYNEVKIHRYPCVQRDTDAVIGRGHSSPVSQLRFSMDD